MDNKYLKVRVISPKEDMFTGLAQSVSSVNSAGKFDILPMHANFITLIQNSPIIIKKDSGQTVTYYFPLAIVYTYKNTVNIYSDIQLKPEI